MVRFAKYVAMLICLVKGVALCYNLVCSQTLSLNFSPLNNILGPYRKLIEGNCKTLCVCMYVCVCVCVCVFLSSIYKVLFLLDLV